MKNFLTIVLLITCIFCKAQKQTKSIASPSKVSSKPSAPASKYNSASTQNLTIPQIHSPCLDKQFSIVFYVITDSTYQQSPSYPGISPATQSTLNALIDTLNRYFKPICVSFVTCKTVIIPNYYYGKHWTKNQTEPIVTNTWYTDQTINFYIVDSVRLGGGNNELDGYTYQPTAINLPPARRDLLVLERWKLLQGSSNVVAHLLGHYFGLVHTFDEINPTPAAVPPPPLGVFSQEFVDGTNCAVHGDGFCDTEADSGSSLITQDGKGDYYIYPYDNIMTYNTQRCRFSQQQYNYMATVITNLRLYLH